MKNHKWIIVVGRPILKNWEEQFGKPNMSNVGQPVFFEGFDTRAQARKVAKEYTDSNPYWKYVAKKKEMPLSVSLPDDWLNPYSE